MDEESESDSPHSDPRLAELRLGDVVPLLAEPERVGDERVAGRDARAPLEARVLGRPREARVGELVEGHDLSGAGKRLLLAAREVRAIERLAERLHLPLEMDASPGRGAEVRHELDLDAEQAVGTDPAEERDRPR